MTSPDDLAVLPRNGAPARLESLPDDLLRYLSGWFDLHSFVSFLQVCQGFKGAVGHDEQIWRELYFRDPKLSRLPKRNYASWQREYAKLTLRSLVADIKFADRHTQSELETRVGSKCNLLRIHQESAIELQRRLSEAESQLANETMGLWQAQQDNDSPRVMCYEHLIQASRQLTSDYRENLLSAEKDIGKTSKQLLHYVRACHIKKRRPALMAHVNQSFVQLKLRNPLLGISKRSVPAPEGPQ